MNRVISFISKDASWQKYRNDVLTRLGEKYGYKTIVLTTGRLKSHIIGSEFISYETFSNFFSNFFKVSFFPGALLYIAKNKPDYVFAILNASQLTEFLALPLCKSLKIPIIYWTHGYDHFEELKWIRRLVNYLRRKYIIYFARHADHIITFSEKGKDYLIDRHISEQKITVAPNTLDTEKISSVRNSLVEKYSKSYLKEKLGFSKDSKILLFSGRLNKLKRVDFALRVHKILTENDMNVHFIVIGDGPEKDYLTSLVQNEKIRNVHFLGSLFEEQRVSQYFIISDIFLMPGYVGLAIIHTFCFGLPIITGKVFHSPEIQFLRHNENGLILDLDEKLFAERIIKLFDNSMMLKSFSDNAFKTVENEGHIDNMLSAMDRAFRSLVRDTSQ